MGGQSRPGRPYMYEGLKTKRAFHPDYPEEFGSGIFRNFEFYSNSYRASKFAYLIQFEENKLCIT